MKNFNPSIKMKMKNKYTLIGKNNFVSFFYPRQITYNQIFEML